MKRICECNHHVDAHKIVKEYKVSRSVQDNSSGYITVFDGTGCRHCVCVSYYVKRNNDEQIEG